MDVHQSLKGPCTARDNGPEIKDAGCGTQFVMRYFRPVLLESWLKLT